jgi:hypothetical protein
MTREGDDLLTALQESFRDVLPGITKCTFHSDFHFDSFLALPPSAAANSSAEDAL